MGNDLDYHWKNGKEYACEHVQEMLQGQIKFLQEYPAIKVLKGGVHTT